MKEGRYRNFILSVIAIALIVNVLQNFELIPKANAESETVQQYVRIPVNEDGTIDVNIRSMSQESMNVNIFEVGGELVRKAVPIKPDGNIMDVNINEVGGWSVSSGKIPVEN